MLLYLCKVGGYAKFTLNMKGGICMTKVISINNFKGGVSKTSTTAGIAYVLSKVKKKSVLVVDLDPQADLTDLLLKSFNRSETNLLTEVLGSHDETLIDEKEDAILDALLSKSNTYNEKDLFHTLKDGSSLKQCLIELNDQLSLIPSDFNMIGFPYLLEDLGLNRVDGSRYFDSFLQEIKHNYDYILIDTPPTLSDFANNAIYACDYSLIVVQTHVRSFNAVEKLISHLGTFRDLHRNNFAIAGILPVMFKNKGKIDTFIMKVLDRVYKDNVFKNKVFQRERVKYWDVNGIKNEDMHDKNALNMYVNITDELIEKVEGDD